MSDCEGVGVVCFCLDEPVREKTVRELYSEIGVLQGEISAVVADVRNNAVLSEFAEKVRQTGAIGMMGLLPKIPEVLPELAPLLGALQRSAEMNKIHQELLGKLIGDIEGLKNGG